MIYIYLTIGLVGTYSLYRVWKRIKGEFTDISYWVEKYGNKYGYYESCKFAFIQMEFESNGFKSRLTKEANNCTGMRVPNIRDSVGIVGETESGFAIYDCLENCIHDYWLRQRNIGLEDASTLYGWWWENAFTKPVYSKDYWSPHVINSWDWWYLKGNYQPMNPWYYRIIAGVLVGLGGVFITKKLKR